jgi:hypothetical protein
VPTPRLGKHGAAADPEADAMACPRRGMGLLQGQCVEPGLAAGQDRSLVNATAQGRSYAGARSGGDQFGDARPAQGCGDVSEDAQHLPLEAGITALIGSLRSMSSTTPSDEIRTDLISSEGR